MDKRRSTLSNIRATLTSIATSASGLDVSRASNIRRRASIITRKEAESTKNDDADVLFHEDPEDVTLKVPAVAASTSESVINDNNDDIKTNHSKTDNNEKEEEPADASALKSETVADSPPVPTRAPLANWKQSILVLKVGLVQGRALIPDKFKISQSKVYIVFTIRGQTHRSTKKLRTQDPVWNEKFTFHIPTPFHPDVMNLEIGVMVGDKGRPAQRVATHKIPVQKIWDQFNLMHHYEIWFTMDNGRNGELNLEFSCEVPTCTMDGMLTKEGGRTKSWKWRYFVLKNGKLSYYRSPWELEPIKTFSIVNVKFSKSKKRKYANLFELHAKHRTYLLYAMTSQQLEHWFEALQLEGAILIKARDEV